VRKIQDLTSMLIRSSGKSGIRNKNGRIISGKKPIQTRQSGRNGLRPLQDGKTNGKSHLGSPTITMDIEIADHYLIALPN